MVRALRKRKLLSLHSNLHSTKFRELTDIKPEINSLKNHFLNLNIPAKAPKVLFKANPLSIINFVNFILQHGVIPKLLMCSTVMPHFKKR